MLSVGHKCLLVTLVEGHYYIKLFLLITYSEVGDRVLLKSEKGFRSLLGGESSHKSGKVKM